MVSASVVDGTGRFSQNEISEFRERYRNFMKRARRTATRNLDRFISRRARSRFLCWDVLKRLRSPAGSVDIDHAILVDHFRSIFFTSSEPLRFFNPWSTFSPNIEGITLGLVVYLFIFHLKTFPVVFSFILFEISNYLFLPIADIHKKQTLVNLDDQFSDAELQRALIDLNGDAAVGPERIPS